jgi:Calx-beta domain
MKLIRFGLLIAFVGALIGFSSCGSKKDPAPLPTVKFTNATATYAEDKGTGNVEVSISAKAAADVVVTYTWTSPDTTAFLGGDFKFTSAATVTIPAGATTANIPIQVIDDAQIDGDNKIELKLATTSVNSKLSTTAADLVFDLTITDNEEVQADRLQVDLIWWKDGAVFGDINVANLNLKLQQNVGYTRDPADQHVILTGGADSGTPFASSLNTSGFETLYLNAADPVQKYFIRIDYYGGSGAINFVVVLNGMGRDFDYLGGQFDASSAPSGGSYHYGAFGPFLNTDGIFDFTSTRIGTSGKTKSRVSRVYQINNSGSKMINLMLDK